MGAQDTLWNLEPHTLGKHQVLRHYLGAWLPIQSSRSNRILFVDGFSGPGQYATGEPGSPLIALNVLLEHHYREHITAEVVYLFIEQNPDRAAHLESLIEEKRQSGEIPDNCSIFVECTDFETILTDALDYTEENNSQLAPTFLMVDPFGIQGLSMGLLGRVLQNPNTEIYATFMIEPINRFISTPEFEDHLNALYGTDAWQAAIDMHGEKRRNYLYKLYESQLRQAGAKYVLRFEIKSGNRLKYAIFHASQHELACDRMKQAIWKATDGSYTFVGQASAQLAFDLDEEDLNPLRQQLIDRFGGQWVYISQLEQFIQSDETLFHSGHLKAKTLRQMERENLLEVDESTRKRRGTYPSGTRLRLLFS